MLRTIASCRSCRSRVLPSMATFIHHDGALGDVLLSLPAIRAIRDKHGPVHLAGRPDIARFLLEAGEVDAVSSSDDRIYAVLYADHPASGTRTPFDGFDRAYVFSVHPDQPLAAALSGIIPRTAVVRTIPPEGERTHVAKYRLQQLGQENTDGFIPLSIPSIYRKRAADILGRPGADEGRAVIAIHPGSGGMAKCWPLENYFELIERMQQDRGAFIMLLTGPAEDRTVRERIAGFCRTRTATLPVADEDLPTVAALLARCRLTIGNDSGISHLAAAIGCAVVSLFGPTDPALWKPLGPAVRVVTPKCGGDIAAITTDMVAGAVHEVQN